LEEAQLVQQPTVKDVLMEVSAEELTEHSFRRVATMAFVSEKSAEELSGLLADWDSFSKDLASKEAGPVLQGYCLLISGDMDAAEEVLKGQKRNLWGAFYLARTVFLKGRIEEALKLAEEAGEKWPDFLPLTYLAVEADCRLGRTVEAGKLIDKLRKGDDGSPELLFYTGYYLERNGEYAEAIQSYRQAVAIDSQYADAYFRLGRLLDLYGTDADDANDESVVALEACVRIMPVHTNAVMNLGCLYEDRERYHDAIKCYESILRHYPNHAQARLYAGDAEASTRMFYDREQEKKADKHSQVLKIPVSDFELSVRSRNCLQKMNIQTLGDLIMKTEQELLSYKNFGETSLSEIKEVLSQKGLRLGQGLEDKGGDVPPGRNPLEATAAPEVLSMPIDELSLSVRSRRCMERLEVHTVRDLINKTEVELMSAKNFGMTSLNEIKKKLAEMGLSLRS
jgi:DNA-directed RNA polymerase subunit alpha